MKKIRLFLTGLLLAVTSAAFAQDITVTGTVTDASTGDVIVGASVVLKGSTTEWTMTDDLGQYSLTVPANGVLEVSFMGYLTQEIPVNGRASLDVALELDAQMLDDVIVVGYGTARKVSSVVGAASTVKSQVVMNRPSANLGDALQGQVSGLQIFSSTGEPMSTVSMRLRGVNSINASSTPLFVLDGSPVSASVFNTLNSNDVESMVVLKDASATAIYGSRAANGVIYITTKKGKRSEKPEVKLRGQYGISTMINHKLKLMNTEQWFQFNELVNPDFQMTEEQKIARELGINTDWMSYLFNDAAPVWSADLSVSGASEKTDYYFSLGAFDQTGIAPDSYMDRFNVRSNINTRATDWLQFGMNLGLTYQTYRSGPYTSSDYRNYWNNPINMATWSLPWWTPYEIKNDENGNPYVDYSSEKKYLNSTLGWNPFYVNDLAPSSTNYTWLNGSTYAQLTPVKGLTIRAQQALEAYDWRSQSKSHPLPQGEGPYQSGSASESFYRYYQFTFTNTIEYKFDIAQKNHFSILAGQESIFDKYEGFGVSVSGLTDWRNNLVSQAPESGWKSPSYSLTETAYNSYFARLSYDYADRYYIDASWRIDGSSLFGSGNQYANFYSIGLMWNVKGEKWMQGASWVNDLRVKASYGTTGNSGISNYLAIGTIGNYSGHYNDVKGWGISNPENSGLTWETVENLNIGVTARLWNFLNVSVDFYNKMTRNLLMEIPYSFTTGHSGGWGNAGDMLNRGVDVDLTFDIIQTNDIYFGISTNFNYNHNEITELFGGRDEYTIANTGISYQTGYPYGEFFYVRSAGVDPADGMQMWYDLDGNKTKNYSDNYAVMLGKQRYAPWSGGISLNFQYKGLYVGADFSWVAGKYTINNDRYFITSPQNIMSNMNGTVEMLNIWTEPGQVTDIPGLNSQRQFDETFIENASFFRLKNLQIGYNFPQKWMDRTGFIKGFRIYFVGRNLLTFTEYSGYDPEVDSNLQLGVYPNSRQFTVGAEFTF